MMEPASTTRPINPTLAVIDGGLNFKAGVQMSPTVQKPKLLEQIRQAIRIRHYSPRTEESYIHWIKRFIFFHNKRHPAEMAEAENRTVPFQLSYGFEGQWLYAEPGPECAAVPVSPRLGQRNRLCEWRGARQESSSVASRADAWGNSSPARLSRWL